MLKFWRRVGNEMNGWPDTVVSIALLSIGLFLIALAVLPQHGVLKAGVLAWVVLP